LNKQDDPSSESQGSPPSTIGRRGFLRGAATLTVGGLGATAGLTPADGQQAAAPAPAAAPQAAALEAQTARAMRWAGRDPADFVRPRAGADHNVVIVGGGQSGVAIAYGLKRKGVGRVEVIDRAAPGEAGIWRTIARMHQLRTPKTLAGPELGNPMLSFRAWYETLNGPEAFDKLDRIPREAWADYLMWFQQATGTAVRYGTKLVEIEPQGDLLRLHLEENGVARVATTRKVVLANGYAGAGGPNVPEFIRALPQNLWTHTTGRLPVETFAGKVIGVVGAGSSAFDAAAVALEAGASAVHLFSRRSYIDYPAPPGSPPAQVLPERGHPNVIELSVEQPDVVKWRNFVLGDRRVASVPFDSLQRAVAFKTFHLHLNSSLSDLSVVGNGKIVGKVQGRTIRLDHLIAGTGYRIDLSLQPELKRIHEHVALWRDRYKPAAGEENEAGASHPYLGAGFEFQPRGNTGAEYLRNIHCFNLAGALSFGIPVGDVPSTVLYPRLFAGVARDLYVESVDVALHKQFVDTPLVAPSSAPYDSVVEGRSRDVA
jgi:cation diffusion facilitator CzcD-associated flavoprotein CzcO